MPEAHSPIFENSSRRWPRILWVCCAGLLALLALLVGPLAACGGPSVGLLGLSSSPATPAVTPPPYLEPALTRLDTGSLTVPEKSRFAEESFWARVGETYLVTFSLDATKSGGSGGRSMYLGVTFSCSPQQGGPGISLGGTKNILTA